MSKLIRKLLTFILVVGGLLILGLGYLGFVPGVSGLFGSAQPVDLGLRATESDRVSANQKLKQTLFDPDESRASTALQVMRNGPTNTVSTALTAPEVAAHLMQMHPFSDLQIRFNADGTFEAAGKIDTPRVTTYLKTLELTNIKGVDVLKTMDRWLTGRPTIYVKGTGLIEQEKVTLQLTEAKIGRVPLAPVQFAQGLRAYVEAVMANVPGLDVEEISSAVGQATFIGQVPAFVPQY